MLNIKMWTKGGPVFTFNLPGGGSPLCPPRELRYCFWHLCLHWS